MTKKILIAVGGTGGHLFPAMALAQQLNKVGGVEVRFIGGGLSDNSLFDPAAHSFLDVPCASMRDRNPVQILRSASKILRGALQSRTLLKAWKPDLIVGFGSFHTLPTLIAARFSSIPLILHEGNRIPGKVNRYFSCRARVTATHFPQTKITGRAMEVGMPLREGYTASFRSKEAARRALGLRPGAFTFLVFGGSQGSLAVNALFCSALSHALALGSANIQVFHCTGSVALVEEIEKEYERHGVSAVVKEFEERIDLAWESADLAVTRAGANTIAEMVEFGVPAILIPYPYAADLHQDANADFMVETGGAIKLNERELESESLAATIRDVVADDRSVLKGMQRALETYRQSRKHRDLCSVVCEVAGVPVR
jgi:UDP-N-acetylglucosamine--N-acetylmuramyl-(pentapeptide) pyrophosphoryl-undecaprenol N-acetylglucosamine transferase